MLIRVVDLETTGFKPPPDDDVVEFGWCDVVSMTRDLIGGHAGWAPGLPSAVYVNPLRSIPPEASAIHHIINADVENGGFLFADVVMVKLNADWSEIGEPAVDVIAAHSAKFERQWITDEHTGGKPWICTYKCALRLWPDAPIHSNQGLRYWRRPSHLHREIASEAHRAGPDAYVTAHLLADMLAEKPVEQLIEWSSQPALQVRCHIGQNRGKLWTEVDYSFLEWISRRDFDEDVIFTVRHEMARRDKARADAQQAADGPPDGDDG